MQKSGQVLPTSNFLQVEPNSHFWTSIDMLLNYISTYQQVNSPGNCSQLLSHLETGLENTKKNGYDIRKIENGTNWRGGPRP